MPATVAGGGSAVVADDRAEAAGPQHDPASGEPEAPASGEPEAPASGELGPKPSVPAVWALPVVAVAVYLLDQATKHWALQNLQDEPIDLIGSLRLNLAFNTGAAFSGGEGLGPLIAIVVVVVVVVLILRRHHVIDSAVGTVAVGLIAGGAIGNLSDRLFRAGEGMLGGAVVDFVDLQWWPVFNVADAAVVVGGLMLVADSLRSQAAASKASTGPG